MPDNVSFRLVKGDHKEISKWYPFWIGTMLGFVFVFSAFLIAFLDISRANIMHDSFLNFTQRTALNRAKRSGSMMQMGSARISIASPLKDSRVSGTTEVSATITSNGISAVKFLLDGSELAVFSAGSYAYAWDTTKTANGEHVIAVLATDTKGYTTIAQQSVIVEN